MGSDMLRAAALHSLVNALPPDGQAQQGPGPHGQGVMSQQQGMGMGLPQQQQRISLGLPAQQQASPQQGHMGLLPQQLGHGMLPPHQQHSQAMFLPPQGQAGQSVPLLQQQAPHAFPAGRDPDAQATVGQIQHYYEVLLHQQQVQNLLQQQQLNVLLLQQAQQQKQQQQPTRRREGTTRRAGQRGSRSRGSRQGQQAPPAGAGSAFAAPAWQQQQRVSPMARPGLQAGSGDRDGSSGRSSGTGVFLPPVSSLPASGSPVPEVAQEQAVPRVEASRTQSMQVTSASQRRVSPFSNAALPARLQDLGRPASTPPTLQLHPSQPLSQLGPWPLLACTKSSAADCHGPLEADPAGSTDPGSASDAAWENSPDTEVYAMDVSPSPAQQPTLLPQLEAASSEGDLLGPSSGLKGQVAPDTGLGHGAGGMPLPSTQAALLPEQPGQFPGQLLGREAHPAAGALYSGTLPGPQSVHTQARQQPPRRVSECAAPLSLERGAPTPGMQGQHGQAHSHQVPAGQAAPPLPQGQHMHMPGLQQPALNGGSYLQQLPQHLPGSLGQQPPALQQGMMLPPHSSPSSRQTSLSQQQLLQASRSGTFLRDAAAALNVLQQNQDWAGNSLSSQLSMLSSQSGIMLSQELLNMSQELGSLWLSERDDSADLKPMGSSDLPEWQY